MTVLDIKEACDLLKLAKVTLYKHVRAGEIPAFKCGRVWRFHREALDEWIRARVIEDTNSRSKKRD